MCVLRIAIVAKVRFEMKRPSFPDTKAEVSRYPQQTFLVCLRIDLSQFGTVSQRFTRKLSLTYSVEPFIVELFTVGFLVRSPKRLLRCDLSLGSQLPTRATLKELSKESPKVSRETTTRAQDLANSMPTYFDCQRPDRNRFQTESIDGSGMSASPIFFDLKDQADHKRSA